MQHLLAALALALAVPIATWEPPARAADGPKGAAPDPGADVFGHDRVWSFHIEMTAAEYEAMQPTVLGGFGGFGGFGGPPKGPVAPKAEPKPGAPERETHRAVFGTEFPWAVAALTADGRTVPKVGVRYKGNSTYFATARALKRSLKVDLDRADERARFRGLKALNLHCGVMDPSKAREALAYALYRAAGVPAPRTAFAEVALTVPGKYDREHVGLYTLTENVDKGFLKRHYGTGDGLLMKPERVRGLDFLGPDWARYADTYRPKRAAAPDEAARVIAFARLVNLGTDAQFEREIGDHLDVDAFLRFMAATAVVANLDSFFTNGHNYYLYLHPETKKFHFVPWDTDLSLGNFAFFGTADEQADLSLTKPYPQCRLADRLMANRDRAARYRKVAAEVAAAAFTKDKVLAELAAIEKTVKPLIEKERKAAAARREPAAPAGPFGAAPPDPRAFVEKRAASIAAQLAGTSAGYAPVARGFGPPPPPRPVPGEVLGAQVQTQLRLTDEQKKKLAELQQQVNKELDALLTPEQREHLKRLRAAPPGGGFPFPKQ